MKTTINDLEPIDRHLAHWYAQAGCPNEALDHYQRVFQRLPDDPGLVAEVLNYAKANQIFIPNLTQEIQRYKVNPRMLPLITYHEICRPEKSEELSFQMDTVTNPNLANGGKLTLTGKVQENTTMLSGTFIVLKPGFEVPSGKIFSAEVIICPQ